jgi:hypothetical protein
MSADLVVQSGAPVYWLHANTACYNNEWYNPLINKRFSKNINGKLINIAAGTAQNYFSTGVEFQKDEKVKQYILDFYSKCNLTTVRDALAKKVLSDFRLNVRYIPCTSIFSNDQFNIQKGDGKYLVMNYMVGGGHYKFSQAIDDAKWHDTFLRLYNHLKKNNNIILVAHNQEEFEHALKIAPQSQIFISNNYIDYIKFYSRAKLGIMNRVHGAFCMASFGIPSIVIGSDSRARMADSLEIMNYFVEDATYEQLLNDIENLNLQAEREKLTVIKEKAKCDYFDAFKSI